MLDDLGLVPALLAFMKEFGKRTGLRICFTSVQADKIEALDSLKRTALYRVVQEALTNAVKHGHASLAKVSILLRPNTLCLEISNNGTAFDVARTLNEQRRNCLGIIGMRERMEIVGGTFAITSMPDNSTTVRVQVPFHNGDPAATCNGLGESAVGE